MKNKIVIIIVLLIYSNVFCQEKIKKLYSSIDIEFINPNKVEYYYGLYSPEYKAIIGGQNKIENTGSSFGISYSIHYNVFKKLSLGAITGFQNQNNPDFRMLKLGGSINYFFVDNNNIYAYRGFFRYLLHLRHPASTPLFLHPRHLPLSRNCMDRQ